MPYLGRRVVLGLLALGAMSCCSRPSAQAQEPRPRFVLNPGGPVNQVRDLAFSPDSSRLYSAGFDKAVHAWELRNPVARPGDVSVVQTLRWEIARGLRGVIYALAASPVDRRLAIAGYSARDAGGDIVIYDTAQAQVERPCTGIDKRWARWRFHPMAPSWLRSAWTASCGSGAARNGRRRHCAPRSLALTIDKAWSSSTTPRWP